MRGTEGGEKRGPWSLCISPVKHAGWLYAQAQGQAGERWSSGGVGEGCLFARPKELGLKSVPVVKIARVWHGLGEQRGENRVAGKSVCLTICAPPCATQIHRSMTLEEFKFIYWMEYAHRWVWGGGEGG